MTGQYSHMHFFRRTPNKQLASYFLSKNIDLGATRKGFEEKKVEGIFQFFNSLSEVHQAQSEADFQHVNAMACEGGVQALIDEADHHQDKTFAEEISAIEGFHAKVMWAFVEKPDYWRGANLFLHADNVSVSFWKKRNDIPRVPPHVDEEDIKELENAISEFFHKKEGRGKNCKVEPYRRYNREYFFAYPEDYAQSEAEWISNTLKTRPQHPAFEIIFVYNQDEGSLDIYAPKNTKAVPELQKLFAKTILKLETLPDGTIDPRVYDLNPVVEPNFDFQIEPESDIADVVVTRLRLTLKHGSRRRITLEADTKHNPKAVYDLLDELKPPAYFITQLGLKVIFESAAGRQAKSRNFNVTHPCYCALNYEGKDLQIRNMLARSGIEPKISS